jgi:hypothetical protein
MVDPKVWQLAACVLVAACSSQTSTNASASFADASTPSDQGSPAAGLPLGAPCTPDDEQQASFSGFSRSEVDIDEVTPQCASGTCLVDHFQGRVTCPYGQTQTEVETLPPGDPKRCRTTDVNHHVGTEQVTVSVTPQVVTRRPEDAVFCSCRCAGSDPGATYCTCPSGMACVPLLSGIGPDAGPTSFCVKPDQDAGDGSATTCAKTGTDPVTDCGNDRENP